jgi:uncharacterized protein with ATP-grasp and redox domains
VVSPDPEIQRRILARVAAYAAEATLDQTPAQMSSPVYRIVSEISGAPDPYARHKRETNRIALALAPEIRKLIASAPDPLAAALRAAVAGNVIDLGIGQAFDINRDIAELMRRPFAVDALERFRQELVPGRRLLILGDNAGEIVFDTLLVEELLKTGVQVTCTVKSGPIINDALMADAVAVGLTRLVPVIETGSDAIGVDWGRASAEFMAAVAGADVVLGKGHGNFETCHDRPGNFYFLLKAKCPIVAEAIGCRVGDHVFTTGSARAHLIHQKPPSKTRKENGTSSAKYAKGRENKK